MPSDRPAGAGHRAQVSAGDGAAFAAGERRRECLYLGYPVRHHYAERDEREGKQKKLTDYREDKNGIARYMRKPGQGRNDDSLKRANRRAAEAFTDYGGMPRLAGAERPGPGADKKSPAAPAR